jgi:hypothetical protein
MTTLSGRITYIPRTVGDRVIPEPRDLVSGDAEYFVTQTGAAVSTKFVSEVASVLRLFPGRVVTGDLFANGETRITATHYNVWEENRFGESDPLVH